MRSFYSLITSESSPSDRLMSMFALIMAINYPLYGFFWFYNDYKGYLGVGLRLVATGLCLAMLLRKYWPVQIKKWLPVYWFGMVPFCLPFFFVYMTLKNHGEVLWIMNTLSALFFTLIIFDFFSAMMVLGLGCVLAWASFTALGNHFAFMPGALNIAGVLATFFAAIIIGGIFTRIRGIAEDEKRKELIVNEAVQRSKLIDQEKFSALARKVAHDINSPLSALKVMLGLCDELPKEKRDVLHRATESILDIANNLIANNQTSQHPHGIEAEPRQSLLLSDLLIQLLSEKKIQYREKSIRFEADIAENAQFAFIRTQKSELRRAVSNLINNAVDALKEKKDARVTVSVTATNHAVMLTVEDNGQGIPEENVQKMHQRRYFTEGKENGHGIGLRQVWDMLYENRGRLAVQSTLGQGTSVKLTFPRSAAAKWIAQEIRLTPDQIIVILDDEQSIHDVWDMHFALLLKTYPQLRLHHFTQGKKLLGFIDRLEHSQKDNVLLLSDYQLLYQPKNGIEIIQSINIKHAILVTSHYANPAVRDAAAKLKIKILPKQMALLLPIHVET
jgi:signal transduction histidine kinase